ncbi:MAG: hypothetical protein F6K14_15965 [Symploca sp. SIO2C1]|nr:hypothetical protein [Symploca sp. SIO2C1]
MKILFVLATVLVMLGMQPSNSSLPVVRLPLEQVKTDYQTAELQFNKVLHTQESYEVRVFLNQPDANAQTPTEGNNHYAGSLFFYGQGQYIDEQGQKFSSRDPRAQEFDLSPRASNTSSFTLYLDITDSLHQFLNDAEISVSLVAVDAEENQITNPDLAFDSISLVTE